LVKTQECESDSSAAFADRADAFAAPRAAAAVAHQRVILRRRVDHQDFLNSNLLVIIGRRTHILAVREPPATRAPW
jgi:hypothetical protein